MASEENKIRIAIIACSENRRRNLKVEIERKTGIEIVACTALTDAFLHQLSTASADVLLVDMYEEDELDPELFQQLLSTKDLPIVFNDSESDQDVITQAWVDKLVDKLSKSLQKKTPKRSKVKRKPEKDPLEIKTHDTFIKTSSKPSASSPAQQASQQGSVKNKLAENFKKNMRQGAGYDSLAIDFEEEMGIPTLSSNNQDGAKDKDAAHHGAHKAKSEAPTLSVQADAKQPQIKKKPIAAEKKSVQEKAKPAASEPPMVKPAVSPAAKSQAGKPARKKPAPKNESFFESSDSDSNVDYFTLDDFNLAEPETETKEATKKPNKASSINNQQIWVLGASIGGPQAVKRFLSSLPDQTGIRFLLVQHIGINFVDLLAEQLERSTPFRVLCATQDSVLKPDQVLVTPADQYLTFGAQGSISLRHRDKAQIYNPCIDDVLLEIAKSLPGANAIIFSGMGDDGAKGVVNINKAGGKVWAQDEDSCIVSSMPDCARGKGVVSFSGTPEAMAEHFVQEINGTGQAQKKRGVN